jgi:trehalose-6-phosphate synthase
MRITFRLILSLILGVTLVALGFSYFQIRQEEIRLREELELRAAVLAESLQESVEPLIEKGPSKNLQRIVERFGNRKRLSGVAIYDTDFRPLAMTPGLSDLLPRSPAAAFEAIRTDSGFSEFQTINDKPTHIYALPLHRDATLTGVLVLLHNASHISVQAAGTWRLDFIRLLIQTLLITAVTVLLVRWSIAGPIAKTAEWMKKLRTGESSAQVNLPQADLFKPLAQEVIHLTKSLSAARAVAQEEARLREAAESLWTSERLKEHVKSKLQGRTLFVVSNREPYIHTRKGKEIQVVVPASGLVTAMEPILRACGGTWLAHGGGDADRETSDQQGKLRVPPDDPQYSLKRVWLTKEEEQGYYYGFSNEGLWPLCHIAHTRPVFRAEDWAFYQAANLKFADSLLQELEGLEEPCVLIQDYHFALLPRLIKVKRPDARVAIFWHIPWPNPEAFGICPWQKELLHGLLGADLIGFHIQFHCNNFLETVDRVLESRIDWERFAVNQSGHSTWVKPFPISIAFPAAVPAHLAESHTESSKALLLKNLGLKAAHLGVGVDRIDYTKGILERFRGIERFLEKFPVYQQQMTFVELGAPSRTHIKHYHDLLGQVEAEADRINWRFRTKDWKPIVFLEGHHSHEEIQPYYRAADFCLVTSLHDGMNLVAKEFAAACESEQGVLILSCFAGASRELPSALIINPYDTEQMAEAIRYALEMSPEERATRMSRLRSTVREANVYCWAANLVTELSQVPLEIAEIAQPS